MTRRRERVFLNYDERDEWPHRAGLRLTVTRAGIEVDGWYDTFVGLGDSIHLTWAELEAARYEVLRRERR